MLPNRHAAFPYIGYVEILPTYAYHFAHYQYPSASPSPTPHFLFTNPVSNILKVIIASQNIIKIL